MARGIRTPAPSLSDSRKTRYFGGKVPHRFPLLAIGAAVRNGAVARELTGVARVVLTSSLGSRHRDLDASAAPDGLPGRSRFATPVVLVHGYGGSRSTWQYLEAGLREAGFANRRVMAYDAFSADIPAIARTLVNVSRDAMDRGGVRELHLVGHSLGGGGAS
jgi:pimeloyl-ACP methyl ester carboxylesterase